MAMEMSFWTILVSFAQNLPMLHKFILLCIVLLVGYQIGSYSYTESGICFSFYIFLTAILIYVYIYVICMCFAENKQNEIFDFRKTDVIPRKIYFEKVCKPLI